MADIMQIEQLQPLEQHLGYDFKNKFLLLEAVTHKSHEDALLDRCYERLEYVGDAILGSMLAIYFHKEYPRASQGDYTILRAATANNDSLARVAVKNNLQAYLRHRSRELVGSIESFARVVNEASETQGLVEGSAPKVLADMVESIVAAVYYDTNYDYLKTWNVVKPMLSPIVTLDSLERNSPVAKRQKLGHPGMSDADSSKVSHNDDPADSGPNCGARDTSKRGPKDKDLDPKSPTHPKCALNELCAKRSWGAAVYEVTEDGPPHARRFTSSVKVHIPGRPEPYECSSDQGLEQKRKAENSAASAMLEQLKRLEP